MKGRSQKPQDQKGRRTDRVVLRRWRKGGDVIALFPELPATVDGLVTSYQHLGQHGAADYHHVISQTAPVPLDGPDRERDELLAELSSIGYQPAARPHRHGRRLKG
jgi:hypothetical protein